MKQIAETLFRVDSKKKIRSWQISVNQLEDGTAQKITETGVHGGKITPSIVLITQGKNIGKINASNPYTQALAEAEADYTQALRKGYSVGIENAKAETSGSGNLKPMLAQKYCSDMKQKDSKNLEKLGMLGEVVFVQPKKDGNRCNAVITKDGVQLITRKGDPFLPIPHIESQLMGMQWDWDKSEQYVVDGELMSSEMTFNKLNGLLKKGKKSPEDLELVKTVEYHIYDVMMALPYSERYAVLEKANPTDSIKLIDNIEIVATTETIDEHLERWLELGEEGLMIRRDGIPYEHKRSWQLMKYKNFEDAEYKVIDLEADVKGNLGRFVCAPNEVIHDRYGKLIESFRVGVKGISHEEGREMLKNKATYVGKMGTVRYQMVSEFKVPRFGKLVGFREDI